LQDAQSSWPGIAVRRTASLRSAFVPAIHVFLAAQETWMPGTRGYTGARRRRDPGAGHDDAWLVRTTSWQRAARPAFRHPRPLDRLGEESPHVPHHVIGDDRMAFGGRVDGAAVEPGPGRLQDVEQRRTLAMRVGGEERIVWGAEQPPFVPIGQGRGRR